MVNRTLVALVFAIFVLISSLSYAAPVGNIAKPAILRSGMIARYERDMQWGLLPKLNLTSRLTEK